MYVISVLGARILLLSALLCIISLAPTTETIYAKASNQNGSSAIDELLRDTMSLLDSLDMRLNKVKNSSANAMMRDNLRSLDDSASATNLSPTTADETSEEPGRDFVNLDEATIEEALVSELAKRSEQSASQDGDQQPSGATSETMIENKQQQIKKSRQLNHQTINSHQNLIQNYQSLASDSTERHIKVALDLMQSIFASQSYSSKSNQIESFLISPFSIQMVLMLMHLGARGQTRKELSQCLHLTSMDRNVSLPAAMASSPSDEPEMIVGNASESLRKLKRRHQAQSSASGGNKSKIQPIIPAGDDVSHELLGAAIRNLLKDPTVVKALTSANQIFLQRNLPLSPQYEWAIKHYYSSDIKKVDFQHQTQQVGSSLVRNQTSATTSNDGTATNQTSSSEGEKSEVNIQQMINDWVERQTKGKISNFLTSPVSTSTLLMAVNVLYFKGDWQYKFDPADTETDAWFTRANGKTVRVPMMVNRLPLAFAHNPQMKTSVIELPYKAQRLGLFILLPDETSGIFNTIQMLNSTSFANLIASMRKPTPSYEQASNGVNVRIPKFSIESSPRLSQILSQQLGLKTLFSPDLADLSGLFAQPKRNQTADPQTSNPPSQAGLDDLVHKAVLQVDEHGSVAAATSATIVERVGIFNGNYFEADHPFLLFLMDKQTGLVLFSGVYAGPNSTDGDPSQSETSDI